MNDYTQDIDLLVRLACCQRNFYILHDVMEKCSREELIMLQDALMEAYEGNLHHEIAYKLNTLIDQKPTKKVKKEPETKEMKDGGYKPDNQTEE